eukprot:2785352-Amphidinium_carterae.1
MPQMRCGRHPFVAQRAQEEHLNDQQQHKCILNRVATSTGATACRCGCNFAWNSALLPNLPVMRLSTRVLLGAGTPVGNNVLQ